MPSPPMLNISFTFHAKMRILQRGINEETVKEIISKPEYVLDSFENRKIAVKRIGGQLWHVVYMREGNNIKVVTVYYE